MNKELIKHLEIIQNSRRNCMNISKRQFMMTTEPDSIINLNIHSAEKNKFKTLESAFYETWIDQYQTKSNLIFFALFLFLYVCFKILKLKTHYK